MDCIPKASDPGQAAAQNGKDAILMAFDANTALAYSTYVGGTEGSGIGEAIRHMAYHDGTAYFAGVTSPSFPFVDDFPLSPSRRLLQRQLAGR